MAILDTFQMCGGTFVDTANCYGDRHGNPRGSERTIGQWLRSSGADMLLGTKAGYDWAGDPSVRLTIGHLGPELDRSLETLGVNAVDVFWLHRDHQGTPVDEICDATDELITSGRARFVGGSNWSLGRVAAFQDHAAATGRTPFSLVQPLWSLAMWHPQGDRKGMVELDDNMAAYCRKAGIVVIPYRALARGFFDGDYRPDRPLPERPSSAKVALDYFHEENFIRHHRVRALAARRATSPIAVCLAYLRAQPFPTIPIIGAKSPSQVRDCFRTTEIDLTSDEVATLEGRPTSPS